MGDTEGATGTLSRAPGPDDPSGRTNGTTAARAAVPDWEDGEVARSGKGRRRPVTVAGMAALVVMSLLLATGCIAAAGDVATGRATGGKGGREDSEDTPFETVDKLQIDDVFRPVTTLEPMTLKSGEVRFLVGTLAATSSHPALQQVQIRCVDAADEEVVKSTVSGRNTPNNRRLVTTVTVRWLFKAPADGTWYCALYGMGHKEGQSPGELKVVRGTSLQVGGKGVRNGVQWTVDYDKEVNSGATAELANRPYELDAGTQFVDVFASMHVTNNYSSRETQFDSLVETTATLTQLDAYNKPCGQSWVARSTQRVTPETHHDDVAVFQSGIPIRSDRTCTMQVRLRITVKVVSGSPITVHGPAMTDKGPGSPYGNYGILMH